MKKPGWIRFFGWLWVFLVAVWFTAIETSKLPHPQTLNIVLIWACELFGAASLFMWIMGSIVYAFQRRGAELRANSIAEGIRRAGTTPGPAASEASQPAPPPGAVPVRGCQICRRQMATAHCQTHALDLCTFCAKAHDNHVDCRYGPVEPLELGKMFGTGKRPRVMTSPLDLTGTDKD